MPCDLCWYVLYMVLLCIKFWYMALVSILKCDDSKSLNDAAADTLRRVLRLRLTGRGIVVLGIELVTLLHIIIVVVF